MKNEMTLEAKPSLHPSAIKSVSCYTACPVETCDRCGSAINLVNVVTLKDGTSQKFGSECINKILAGDTSLKGLFAKNAKLLKRYKNWLETLRLPVEQWPVGSDYYNSGFFFVAATNGEEIRYGKSGSSLFHPLHFAKPSSPYFRDGAQGDRIKADHAAKPELARQYLAAEILRIESFLARIVAKGLAATVHL